MTITTYKDYRISTTRLGVSWITNIFHSENPGAPLDGVAPTPAAEGENAAVKAAYDFIDEREQKKQAAWQ